MFRFFLFLLIFTPFVKGLASHIPGGNITYECLGNDQYLVTLTLFEDCGTSFESNSPKTIDITNSCGFFSPTQLTVNNTIYAQEVSQLCSSQLPFSECSSGSLPGIYMHQWQGVVTLPDHCDHWTFGYDLCCRNEASNIINASSDSFYIETTLNNDDAACNSSPSVTTQMIPYICVNQPIVYNLGVYEPDGNTLVFSLVDAQNGATGGSLSYAVPNTGAVPIPGITINSSTGDLSFTPTQIGNFVVVVLVEEYDDNGNLVGSLTQDFQFEVINCPANTNPVEPTGITNYTGDGTQISNNEIEVCPGDEFCFQLEFTDLNAGDSIFISSNLSSALPGAQFTQLSFQSPAICEICWTATNSVPSNTNIVFNARDNACPMFGITFFPMKVHILDGVYAGPDVVLCAGDTTYLNATGGTSFVWSSIPGGDTIVDGNNFECSSCATTYALPSITTNYVAEGNLASSCKNKDTVIVEVVPDFDYTLTQESVTSCIGSEVGIEIIPDPVASYNVNWTPSTGLDDPSSLTPNITTSVPGNYEYAVSIESPFGCVRYDTINLTVSNVANPDFEVITSDTNLTCGDTAFFDVNLLTGSVPLCDISSSNACFGASTTTSVGTNDGQNTSTTYPAPFGNWYKNAKHQFLFTAAELNAAGIQGGKITEIAWDVTNTNNSINTHYNYTINMGCTSSNSLIDWETGLVNVFTPQNIFMTMGTNSFVLTNAYEWDGTSNLVIEICFDNRQFNYTNNASTPYTNTAFNSCLVYRSDVDDACGMIGNASPITQRPITTFTVCGVVPDPNNFTFSWQTTNDPVADPASDSTYAIVTNNGEFEVFVTNLIGGCVDSTTINVTAECCGIDEVIIDDVICYGGNDGGLAIIPYSNNATTFDVVVAETISGTTVYNQSGIVDTAFVNGLTAGDYTISITTQEGCMSDTTITISQPVPFVVEIQGDSVMCVGDSLQLSVTGGTVYSWTNAASFSNNTLDTVWFTGSTSEMIFVEVTNATGCLAIDSLQVTVKALPVVTISNDTTICVNDTIPLVASGGVNYSWSPNSDISTQMGASVDVWPTLNTTYTVVVENAEGCLDSAQVDVSVQSLPSIDAGVDVMICIGDTATLNGTGGVSYVWIQGDSILDPQMGITQAWPVNSNTYILEGSDALGCLNYDTMEVTVNPLPTVDAERDLWVCPGTTVQLEATSNGTVFTWTPISDLSDPNILTPDASPNDTTMYYLTVESAFGCVNMDSMTVFAGGPVPTDAGLNDTICEGDSVMIGGAPTAVAGTLFSWQPSGSIVDNTIGNPIVFPSNDTWFVVYTANDTCSGVDSVFVKVNPYPLADAGADFAICIGDTSQLNASGGVIYEWNTQNALSDSTISDPNIYPVVTTDFVVNVTDALGCSQLDTINVLVNPLPIANAGMNDTICYGDTAQLMASGGVNYLWTPNDSISDNMIVDPLVNPSQTADYIVEVTDLNACMNWDTVQIVVNSLPIISAGPDLEMCIYDSIQLTVSGAETYIWSPDSTLSQFDIADPFSAALDDEIFVVEGTDANGCKNTDTVALTVHNLPVVLAGGDTTICYSDTVEVSVSGAVDYAWLPNVNITDTTSNQTYVFPSDSLTYYVTGTDIYGCSNIDSVRILVNQLPNAYAGLNDTICYGDTTQLIASGGVIYVWTPNDSISNNMIFDPEVFPTVSTDYIVTVTDTNGCVNTDTMNVLVNALPPVDAGPDLEMCIYDSIQLNVSGADSYVWSPDSTLSQYDIANPFSYALNDEVFVVEGTDANGCKNTDTITLTVHNLPIVIASADTAICIYDTALLSATGATQYAWTPIIDLTTPSASNTEAYPQDTIIYYVLGTDDNGCQNLDSVEVTVNPLPIANAGIDVDICRGDSTQLMASGGESYSWQPVVNVIDENVFDPIVYPDTTIEYIVTVVDSNACVNYDSVIVNVFRVGTIPDTAICLMDSIQLNVYGSPGNQFTWTPSIGLSDANSQDPMASPSSDITYTVTVSDIAGCVDQASVNIVVSQIPIIGYNYILVPDCDGVQVEFTDSSFYADEYDWNFSNGENSDDIDPVTLFDYSTQASVDLTLSNQYGCVTDSSFSIKLNDFDSFYGIHIPNVFTPNGDGQNDYFWVQVPGNLAECLDLKIYNRWGMLIFKSFGGVTTWDGKNADGDEVPDGTYLFTIEIEDYKYEGTLTIFR